jgi:hypothetical protein
MIAGNFRRLNRVLILIAGAIVVLAAIVTPISESGVALPFPLKVIITVALIAPVGFAMGMPFPTGLALLEKSMPEAVRWAWSINAAASVLGSAAAMFLAIYVGLQLTLIIGGAFYLAAMLSASASPLKRNASNEFAAGL